MQSNLICGISCTNSEEFLHVIVKKTLHFLTFKNPLIFKVGKEKAYLRTDSTPLWYNPKTSPYADFKVLSDILISRKKHLISLTYMLSSNDSVVRLLKRVNAVHLEKSVALRKRIVSNKVYNFFLLRWSKNSSIVIRTAVEEPG